MRLRNFLKLISSLTAGVIITVSTLIFICPTLIMPNMSASSVVSPALCSGDFVDAVMVGNVGALGDCLGIHLVNAHRFTESLFGKADLWLVAFFVIMVAYSTIAATNHLSALRAAFARYKNYYRLFSDSIRLQCQKKIMAWLSLLKNHVSLA